MFPIILGRDTTTEHEVSLEDTSRYSGMYVLGKSGMGKSVLLSSMACQDDYNKQGFFFLDPHGDATNEILPHLFSEAACVLNVEDETHSFGINLISCRNKESLRERTATYTRAYNAFKKIFQNEKGEWGPWLQEVIQYSLYVFIENPGYTLAELPLFLINKAFRENLLENVRHNLDAVTFWRREFQSDQARSALTRIRTLLGHEIVRDIIGQETTLDFAKVMDEDLVVILQLSSNLPEDAKRFLGIIVLNELLHAVRNRPEGKRHPFSIFIDEMHNFISSDDLSTLITEGRKFGVMFTGAHQERYGQLADHRKIAGATLATLNKVFFQLSVADAQEVAAEFADSPPVEYRRERAIIISKQPVWDLLNIGHVNPRVQELAQEFFGNLEREMRLNKECIEDIRLEHLQAHEDAAYEQGLASLGNVTQRRISGARGLSHEGLDEMEAAFTNALALKGLSSSQVFMLTEFHKKFRRYKDRIEFGNTYLSRLMEGRVKAVPGEEGFVDVIRYLFGNFYLDDKDKLSIWLFYIHMRFDDPSKPRGTPAALAVKHWPNEVKKLFLDHRNKQRKLQREEYIISTYGQKNMQEGYFKALAYRNRRDDFRNTFHREGTFDEIVEFGWQMALERSEKEDEEMFTRGIFYENRVPCVRAKEEYSWGSLDKTPIPGEVFRLPDLPMRVISGAERARMQSLAEKEIPAIVLQKLTEFLELLALLQRPENHIAVQSTQYMQTPHHTRTTHDMAGEMVQTLTSLPRYTAMVKLMGETQSEKYTMKTRGIEAPWHGHPIKQDPDVAHSRVEILTALYKRQTQWQEQAPKPPPEPPASSESPPRREIKRPPPQTL